MKRLYFLLATAALIFSACATKQEAPAPAPAEKAPVAKEAPQLTPEQMMSKMKEYSTPGEEHAKLAALVGNWKTESKFWMDPSKAPEVSKGTARNQWALGKRFIEQEYRGKVMGQAFQGSGLLGYDKVKKQYFSTWADSMGTGIMISEGSYDAANKQIDMTGKFSCPLTDSDRSARTLTRFVNKNEFVFEMFDKGPDGKEFKTMEITYKKAS